jgi:peptidoglycan/LPS O-acetylase OafA/YrhL
MSVALYHLNVWPFTGGFVGVDVFFVISGYLIGKGVIEDARAGRFSVRRFYLSRVRRLAVPLLLVVVATYAAGYLLLMPQDLSGLANSIIASMTFTANHHFYGTLDYFNADAGLKPLLHLWSLAIEEQFYLLFPLVVLATTKWRRTLSSLVAIAAASMILNGYVTQTDQPAAFFLLPFRAWEFLLGTFVFLLLECSWSPPDWLISTASVVGVALVVWSTMAFTSHTSFPGLAALAPSVGTALAIYAGTIRDTGTRRLISVAPLPFIGRVSYSLYLWHWPIIVFLRYFLDRDLSGVESIGALGASVVFAWWTWLLIERPMWAGAPGWHRYVTIQTSVVASAVVIAIAYPGVRSEGFPHRLTPAAKAFEEGRNDWTDDQFNCVDRTPDQIDAGDICLFDAGEAARSTVLLWGDSHSTVLLPAMQRVSRDEQVDLTFIGSNGCPPILGVGTEKRLCLSTNEAAARMITTVGFDVVMLGAAWTSYGRSNLAFVSGVSVDAHSPLLADRLAETIRQVARTGARVVLVGQAPAYSVNVPNFLAKRQLLSRVDRVFGYDRGIEPSQFNPAFFETAVEQTQAVVLWPSDTLCSTAGCALSVGGASIYKDAGHLSSTGSLLLVDAIKSVLKSGGSGDAPAGPLKR